MPDAQPLSFRRRATLLVVLWVALAVVPIVFPAAMLPFAGSALIAYLVAPIVHWLTGQKVFGRVIPRWVAILAIYALFFLFAYLFIVAIVPQLYRELVRISSNAFNFARSLTPGRIQEIARQMEDWLNSHGVPVALSSRSLEGADAAEAYTGRPSWSLSMDLERLIHDAADRFSGIATGQRHPPGGAHPGAGHRGLQGRLHLLPDADGGGLPLHRRRGDRRLLPLAGAPGVGRRRRGAGPAHRPLAGRGGPGTGDHLHRQRHAHLRRARCSSG